MSPNLPVKGYSYSKSQKAVLLGGVTSDAGLPYREEVKQKMPARYGVVEREREGSVCSSPVSDHGAEAQMGDGGRRGSGASAGTENLKVEQAGGKEC